MNETTYLYTINGKPMLTPDAGVQTEFSDVLSKESGLDEAGYMHRIVQRYKVGCWHFNYSALTQEAYSYMLSLLDPGDNLVFTYPDPNDPTKTKTTIAYIENYGICWYSAKSGLYRNLKFDVIEQ